MTEQSKWNIPRPILFKRTSQVGKKNMYWRAGLGRIVIKMGVFMKQNGNAVTNFCRMRLKMWESWIKRKAFRRIVLRRNRLGDMYLDWKLHELGFIRGKDICREKSVIQKYIVNITVIFFDINSGLIHFFKKGKIPPTYRKRLVVAVLILVIAISEFMQKKLAVEAATAVTSAQNNRITNGSRVAVRNSSGTPYVIVEDYTDGGIEVWKGSKTVGTADSYPTSNQDGEGSISNIFPKHGQSVTGDGKQLDSVEFYVRKINSAAGNVYAKVYVHSGTFGTDSLPTGSPLAVSDALDASTFGTSLGIQRFNFTGTNRIILDNGTKYVVTIESDELTGSEQVGFGVDSSSSSHGGNPSVYHYINGWYISGSSDTIFYLYTQSLTEDSFAEQDSSNNPQASTYGSSSAAIDSTGIIHIAYMYYNAASSDARYVTFNTSTDTFSGDVALNADIGQDPGALTNLQTSIAIDANDIPHVAYTSYIKVGGAAYFTIEYLNKVGGSWNAEVTVESESNAKDNHYPDISIDADNKPVVAYINTTDADASAGIGDANDPSTFTLADIRTPDVDGTENISLVVDGSGNHHVVYGRDTSDYIMASKHNYGDTWTSWSVYSYAVTDDGTGLSAVVDGTTIYVFYEEVATNDIKYATNSTSDTTGTWTINSAIETGTYNSVKTKWGFWVDNDSGGALTSYKYYFNDLTPSDPNSVWINDANAFNGSESTYAETSTAGSASSNYLRGDGTNIDEAPSSISGVSVQLRGNHVANPDTQIFYRVFTSSDEDLSGADFLGPEDAAQDYGPIYKLNIPIGGWSLTVLQNLYVKIWQTGGSVARPRVVYLYVNNRSSASELDYALADETASPDILWNKLSLGINVSGNVYDFGTASTALSECDTDSPSVTYELRLRAGGNTYSATCNDSTGAFIFTGVTGLSPGDGMVIWI